MIDLKQSAIGFSCSSVSLNTFLYHGQVIYGSIISDDHACFNQVLVDLINFIERDNVKRVIFPGPWNLEGWNFKGR